MRPDSKIPKEINLPFPVYYNANVIAGFGRGSSELGIPTANIPVGPLDSLDTGVYFGWSKIVPTEDSETDIVENRKGNDVLFDNGQHLSAEDREVFPMVMSIGWNPFYENKTKAAEIHVIHKFTNNFYGAMMKVVILGYIRPELNYTTKEDLIQDINKDVEIAKGALSISPYKLFEHQISS